MKRLIKLAWPIIVSRSTQSVVGLADSLMVAHLGAEVLASVTTGAINSFAVIIFPMGVVFIVSSFASQFFGRGDFVSARRYGWYGLILALASEILAILSLPFLGPAVRLVDYDPGVAAGLTTYMAIRLLSTGPAVGIEALGNYYGGLGNTGILMRTNMAAMILNVAFNWLLINGHLGFPALGLRGAAIASVSATTLAFLGFFAAFLKQGKSVAKSPLRLTEFTRMLRFGLPMGINWSLEFFAFIAFINVVVAGLGTASLAAMMAVLNINSVSFMPAFGLASAGAILAGQAIGAGNKGEVPGIARLTFFTAAAWMGFVGLFYWLIPRTLLGPFIPSGEAADAFILAGVQMLAMSALWQIFDAGGITYTEVLRAAGDTVFAMWARGILGWVFFLPGSWIHIRYLGGAETAAMAWLIAYVALLCIGLMMRFRGGAWRKIVLVEDTAPLPA